MAVLPSTLAARRAVTHGVRTLALLAVLAAAACGGGGGGDDPTPVIPASISALDAALSGVVGAELTAPIRVRVVDAAGKGARGVVVSWTASGNGTVAPATSTTNGDGVAEARWTLGSLAGPQELGASIAAKGGLRATVAATAAADKPASIRLTGLSGDSVLLLLPGSTFPVTARVVDRFGNPTPGGTVQWSTSDPAIATVDASGSVTARAAGRATLQASADAARGQAAVVVMAPMTLTGPGSATLLPGATLTIDGSGFPTQPGAVTVSVSGATAQVTAVTASQITAAMPAQTALPCEPVGAGRVTVRRHLAGAIDSAVVSARVDASVTRSLAAGESVTMTDGAGCVRLDKGGRYVVSVFNMNNVIASTSSVRVRGVVGSTAADMASAAASAPSFRLVPPPARALTAAERSEVTADVEHARHLEQERAIVGALGSPLPALQARRRAAPGVRASVVAAPPNVGDTVSLNAVYNSCSRGTAVRARVVYVGAKSVVYEDVQSPRAGEMDSELRRVGEEFDTVQYPILERNYATPLAMDAQLDNDGKIAMLFTKYVNDSLPGVIGYITSCNFYAPTQAGAGASNQRELFYARVPRFDGQGQPTETSSEWRRQLRSTVIHEVKHLGSYAARFLAAAGGSPAFEEVWLEEGTARLAEEFYARTFSGAAWKGNATYQSTLACEVVPCAGDDRPKMMLKHYEVLADYYNRIGTLTPLGGVNGSDNTFYASGWLLVRWALDHYANDEASFIKALVTETGATGLTNLSRRTGRPASEMLADWSLALAVDDRAGTSPKRAQLSLPSWNTRDVFRGLNGANAIGFPRQFPLTVQQVPWGAFTLNVPTVRSWSAAFFELAGGTSDGPELVELKSGSGGTLSPQIGIAILRIE